MPFREIEKVVNMKKIMVTIFVNAREERYKHRKERS